jgi:hypothetical protein
MGRKFSRIAQPHVRAWERFTDDKEKKGKGAPFGVVSGLKNIHSGPFARIASISVAASRYRHHELEAERRRGSQYLADEIDRQAAIAAANVVNLRGQAA